MQSNRSSPSAADMDKAPAPHSEWPTALLLDEIWLRVRRVLVHELEHSDLWTRTDQHTAFMQRQQANGWEIAHEVLGDLFGTDDFAYLNSEAAFGRANQRVRQRLPFVLAFGHELGRGYCGLLTSAGAARQSAGELGALFNLGISLFDLTYDQFPLQFGELEEIFNSDVLARLGDDPLAVKLERERWRQLANDDLRVLLTIIAGFFERLHDLRNAVASGADSRLSWTRVLASIDAAYKAEIRSAAMPTESNSAEAREVGRLKSMLPFQVISLIAQFAASPVAADEAEQVDRISDHVGRVFWLMDDLVDIVPDFHDDALNTFLIPKSDSNDLSASRLVELLGGSDIEEAAEAITCSLGSSLAEIAASSDGESETDVYLSMSQVLTSFTRNWLE